MSEASPRPFLAGCAESEALLWTLERSEASHGNALIVPSARRFDFDGDDLRRMIELLTADMHFGDRKAALQKIYDFYSAQTGDDGLPIAFAERYTNVGAAAVKKQTENLQLRFFPIFNLTFRFVEIWSSVERLAGKYSRTLAASSTPLIVRLLTRSKVSSCLIQIFK